MSTFSRCMPPPPSHRTLSPWAVFAPLAAGVGAALVWAPPLGAGLLALAAAGVAVDRWQRAKIRALAAARVGEDIGSFARAFDRRRGPFDPWVVRAVWDALGPYATDDGRRAALRPSDDLGRTVRIDPEDLDTLVLPDVAARTGRTLDRPEANPYYGRVRTVGDLVGFVTAQPRRPAA